MDSDDRREARVTGADIIEEILRNMEESLEPLRYSVLAHGVYRVSLHTQDYERLQGVFPRIRDEAYRALDELLERLNRRPLIPIGREPQRYERATSSWEISFAPDPDGDLDPGDVVVESELAYPVETVRGAGTPTRRIVTRRGQPGARKEVEDSSWPSGSAVTGAVSSGATMTGSASAGAATKDSATSGAVMTGSVPARAAMTGSASAGAAPKNSATSGAVMTGSVPAGAAMTGSAFSGYAMTGGALSGDAPSDSGTSDRSRAAGAGRVLARLIYEDGAGQHCFEMTKDQIVIGRGGSAHWCDLQLDASHDVSREHLRLRHDPATGRFFLKNMSLLGTSIDGREVPRSVEETSAGKVDRNVEIELPRLAQIGLAGVLFLRFEAQEATE